MLGYVFSLNKTLAILSHKVLPESQASQAEKGSLHCSGVLICNSLGANARWRIN